MQFSWMAEALLELGSQQLLQGCATLILSVINLTLVIHVSIVFRKNASHVTQVD